MMTASLTAEDAHVRDAVLEQLERVPGVDDRVIGVTVNDGVVTLTGVIGSHAGKQAAERAAKRVPGVWAVANDLTVDAQAEWTDADVAGDTTQTVKLRPVFQRTFR